MERALWSQGCADWDCFLSSGTSYSLGSASREVARRELAKSKHSLEAGIHQYFGTKLKIRDSWRAFAEFRHSCAYLDIETDGSNEGESITAIGLYDGKDYVCLLKGEDIESFRDRISHYSMIVTFFGTAFDLPVIQKRFPGLLLDQIHIDLCPVLKQLGYRGGLKKIEKEFGIERSEATAGLNGYDAVKLWRAYQRGNSDALDVFVTYNREDTVNLMALAEIAYAKLKEQTLAEPVQSRSRKARVRYLGSESSSLRL
jgi:uncharacterized protein YprB with RNaseH-like and TPR domain